MYRLHIVLLASALATEVEAMLSLTPVGRSFYSTNTSASSYFFQRYFGAVDVTQNLTNDTACAEVSAVAFGESQKEFVITFVSDKVKTAGDLPASAAVHAASSEWEKVVRDRQQLYSPWFDNHDGLSTTNFNIEHAMSDKLELQVYHDDKARFPSAVVRILVPGTAWTIEVAGHFTREEAKELDHWRFDDPDACRNNSKTPALGEMPFWWKATFAADDPAAAAEFAIAALGAEPITGPYPWPAKSGCTIASWVHFRGADFMLHFVKSPEYSTGKDMSVHTWALKQEQSRHLDAGVFDQHMYNSLILWAETLDPLIVRLQAIGAPYLPVRFSSSLFAVFLDIPKNGFTLQIRSSHLTVATAHTFDACKPTKEGSLFV